MMKKVNHTLDKNVVLYGVEHMDDNKLDNIERDLHNLVVANGKLLQTVIDDKERIYQLERRNKIYNIFYIVVTLYMATTTFLGILATFIG